MTKKHVLKLVNTPIRDDPRAVNEGSSLVKLGYWVTAIGLARDPTGGLPVRDHMHGMNAVLVPMVTTKHPYHLIKEFWRILRGDLGITTTPPSSRISNIISFLFFNLWLVRIGFGIKSDIIHCHDVLPLPAAWLLSRYHCVPLIYDARESVPDLYTGIKGRVLAGIEQWFLGKADAVITVGERLKARLQERGAKHVIIIGNWKRKEDYLINTKELEQERQRLNIPEDSLVVSYFGALDPTREIEPLLEAVASSNNVVLLIGGRGMIEEKIRASAKQSANIRWLGWVPMSDIPIYTHLSDAVYYCLNYDQASQDNLSIGNNFYSTPNKLFEAFMAEKAIIARRGVGEIGDILEQIPAGILLDRVTPETIKGAFAKLFEPEYLLSLQRAAGEAHIDYSWEIAEERLQDLYHDLLIQRRR